jgi:hypothetical protein
MRSRPVWMGVRPAPMSGAINTGRDFLCELSYTAGRAYEQPPARGLATGRQQYDQAGGHLEVFAEFRPVTGQSRCASREKRPPTGITPPVGTRMPPEIRSGR